MKPVKSLTIILLIIGLPLLVSHCKNDDPGTAPQVTGFDPIAGAPGDIVMITGRNFSTVVTNNKVNFNGTPAFLIDATSTAITAVVPVGATKGKIAVTVAGTTVFSTDEFTAFLSTPGLTSFAPTSGIPGTSVVISGSGFSPTTTNNVVKFNGVTANITSVTASAITAVVPDGATSGKITVIVSGGTTPATYTSGSDFAILLPTLTSFTPHYGLPGTIITVTGANFNSATPSNNVVTINGTNAAVTEATSTQLKILIPLAATSGKIVVNVGGQTVTSIDSYEVLKDIPRDGLVAFYPFDGSADDASGNNLDGTPTNGPVLTSDRFQKSNQAYTLDGTDDYITMGNPTLLQISNKITVAGWFNLSITKNDMMAIITKVDFTGGNPDRGYHIYQDKGASPDPYFAAYSFNHDGSAFTFSTSVSTDVPTNQWIFIALVGDGTTWKFYQNGQPVAGSTIAGENAIPDGTLGDFVIGQYGNGANFDGSVDDITVYNRSLSDDEIQQLYTQTITKY